MEGSEGRKTSVHFLEVIWVDQGAGVADSQDLLLLGHSGCRHVPWTSSVLWGPRQYHLSMARCSRQSSEKPRQLRGHASDDMAVPFGAGSKHKPQLFLPVAWISDCELGLHPFAGRSVSPEGTMKGLCSSNSTRVLWTQVRPQGLSDELGRDPGRHCREAGLDSSIWTWRSSCCIGGHMGGENSGVCHHLGTRGKDVFASLQLIRSIQDRVYE